MRGKNIGADQDAYQLTRLGARKYEQATNVLRDHVIGNLP